MTAAKQKIDELDEPYEEITVERRIRAPNASCPTRRTKVDDRLLAIARGELEPDDPFGGLIPIYDEDASNDVDVDDIDDGWLSLDSPTTPEEAMLSRAVPRLRLRPNELVGISMSDRAALVVAQIDGFRSVGQLVEICELEELESLEILDELLRMRVIELQ